MHWFDSHFGIVTGICDLLPGNDVQGDDTIMLQFNFDGLPLFKSSRMEFWPIMCATKYFENSKLLMLAYIVVKRNQPVSLIMLPSLLSICKGCYRLVWHTMAITLLLRFIALSAMLRQEHT